MNKDDKIQVHMDYNRARVLLSRIKTVDDLVAIWKIGGPCLEWCPSIEKIQRKKNIS